MSTKHEVREVTIPHKFYRVGPDRYAETCFVIGLWNDRDPNLFHHVLRKNGYPRQFQSQEAAERAIKKLTA